MIVLGLFARASIGLTAAVAAVAASNADSDRRAARISPPEMHTGRALPHSLQFVAEIEGDRPTVRVGPAEACGEAGGAGESLGFSAAFKLGEDDVASCLQASGIGWTIAPLLFDDGARRGLFPRNDIGLESRVGLDRRREFGGSGRAIATFREAPAETLAKYLAQAAAQTAGSQLRMAPVRSGVAAWVRIGPQINVLPLSSDRLPPANRRDAGNAFGFERTGVHTYILARSPATGSMALHQLDRGPLPAAKAANYLRKEGGGVARPKYLQAAEWPLTANQ